MILFSKIISVLLCCSILSSVIILYDTTLLLLDMKNNTYGFIYMYIYAFRLIIPRCNDIGQINSNNHK